MTIRLEQDRFQSGRPAARRGPLLFRSTRSWLHSARRETTSAYKYGKCRPIRASMWSWLEQWVTAGNGSRLTVLMPRIRGDDKVDLCGVWGRVMLLDFIRDVPNRFSHSIVVSRSWQGHVFSALMHLRSDLFQTLGHWLLGSFKTARWKWQWRAKKM